MIRKEAIELISNSIGNNPIVSANGFISRDLFDVHPSDSNFYMIGSMGLSSSIGLGLALKFPKKRIYIFDGDGNILMNLGSLTTIGNISPKNLVHIIYDSESHESTGGQPTSTNKIDLAKIAKSANYKVFKTSTKNGLKLILKKIKSEHGPTLVLVKVKKTSDVSKRISLSPYTIRDRFMKSFKH